MSVVGKRKTRMATTGFSNSSTETDFTAVVRVDGLKPNTDYTYTVHLDSKPGHEDRFNTRTLSTNGNPVSLRLLLAVVRLRAAA